MRNFNIITTVFIFLFLTASLAAQDNCYYKADGDIQQIYQYYMGISLQDGIEQYLAEQHQSALKAGEAVSDTICNISIEVNKGSGFFIGQQNLVEISIKNSFEISAIYAGLEFMLDRDKFRLVEGYGNSNLLIKEITGSGKHIIVDSIKGAIYTHPKAFTNEDIWPSTTEPKAYLNDNKYDIALGGIFMTGEGFIPLPAHFGSVVLFSFLIELPDSIQYTEEELCFRNVFIPPAGTWSVSDLNARDITPNFNGYSNTDKNINDTPPVCFSMSREKNPVLSGLQVNTGQDKSFDFKNYPGLNEDQNGEQTITVQIVYFGSNDDLKNLGASIQSNSDYNKVVQFPLSILPQICQLNGIQEIHSVVSVDKK